MATTTFFTPKIRTGIIHFLVFVFFFYIVTIQFPLIPQDSPSGKVYHWQYLGVILITIFGFYLHSLVLLPILTQQKNIKKYALLVIVCLIVYGVVVLWVESIRSSLITMYLDGSRPNPMDVFIIDLYGWNSLLRLLALIAMFIPFGGITFIYYLLITNEEHRKELFASKFTEPVVNLIVVGVLLFFFYFNLNNIGAFIISLLYLVVVVLFFYINTFFITPKLIEDKNIEKYLVLIFLFFLFFVGGIKLIHLITRFEIGPFSNPIAVVFLFLITYVLSFIYGFLRIKLKAKELLLHLKLDAKDSELQLLKSQVNPHFLFNTLNTLYATALEEGAVKTAESTAKLASLIRYMQEDIDKDFILLENEIKYLEDYILIQKLRCAVEPDIETNFKNIENHHISPGLLIPFVENAFKYGINPSKKSNLKVSVICDENTIYFECINSYDDTFKTYYKEQGFGIGIKNAKQRLELVYPKNHIFEVEKENNIFSVTINITVKNK